VPLAVIRDALSTLGTELRARTACGARLVLRADVAPSASARPGAEARAPQEVHARLAGPLTAAAARAGKSCMFCACGALTNATVPYLAWRLTSAGALPAPLEPANCFCCTPTALHAAPGAQGAPRSTTAPPRRRHPCEPAAQAPAAERPRKD